MSQDMNMCVVLGNVGRDAEIKEFANGGKVANFSVATKESWKDKNTGEWVDKTQWHNIVAKGSYLVGVCERKVKKGSRVWVMGNIETRDYKSQQGDTVYRTEIIAKEFGGRIEVQNSNKSSNSFEQENNESMDSNKDDVIPF